MSDEWISIHVRTNDAAQVQQKVIAQFAERGFRLLADAPAASVVGDEDALADSGDGYGVFVSGAAKGWVSVWVDDWADSGVLARALSRFGPVLEVWMTGSAHWGYTLFSDGDVRDRFADDPAPLAATPEEVKLYAGNAEMLAELLKASPERLAAILEEARTQAGQFPGGPIDALCDTLGLPFDHVFFGYGDFFDDDPDDYMPGMVGWNGFRHLAFQHPQGREQLAD